MVRVVRTKKKREALSLSNNPTIICQRSVPEIGHIDILLSVGIKMSTDMVLRLRYYLGDLSSVLIDVIVSFLFNVYRFNTVIHFHFIFLMKCWKKWIAKE